MAEVHLWHEVVTVLQDRLFDLCCSRSSDEDGGFPVLHVASPRPLNSCPHPSEKDQGQEVQMAREMMSA